MVAGAAVAAIPPIALTLSLVFHRHRHRQFATVAVAEITAGASLVA